MKPWLCPGLIALLLLTVPRADGQLSPDKAEKSLTVSGGLAVTLWASEPLFVNPTCMDIDHLGRAWVCESVNYRNRMRNFKKWTRPEGDRIVILEDSTGSGRADRATTFYQSPELMAPLGIAVAKDPAGPGWKVYYCQSPDLFVLTDADGDGKADGPPTKLLSGFRGIDHDHGVHGLLIGPDRRLYFSVGDAGVGGLQSSDGKGRKWSSNDTDCRAGTIWRCELDGSNLQLIAHNFRNEYEPCVDSFGNVFVSDNDDDGNQQTRICFVLPGGNYGYHPRGRGESHWHEEQAGVVPKILRTYFGSPTGMCVYEGSLLPRKYHGQLLHTDAGPRHLRAYHLSPQGASFAVEREDVVASTDNWFRPADVCVAPDGSLLVADWYDPGVGGHGMGDITRGRIYRVAPVGHRGGTVPKVDLTTPKGLLAALASPTLAVRYLAMARLDGMKKPDALAVLTPAAKQSDDAVLRARALWQIARLGGAEARSNEAILAAFTDRDPRIQVLAVRLARDHLNYTPEQLATFLTGLNRAGKAAPAVHREGLLALRDADPETVKSTLYELMKAYDGKDRFYLAAVGIAVGHHDAKRRQAILSDFGSHFGTWDDRVAGLVWELRPPQLLALLESRLFKGDLAVEQRVQIADVLATSADPGAGDAMIRLLAEGIPAPLRDRAAEYLRQYLPGKWQAMRANRELTTAIATLLRQAETRVTALGLIAAAGQNASLAEVVRLAGEAKEPLAVRRAAVATLGQLPTPEAVTALARLLVDAPVELQSAAAISLGELTRLPGDVPVTTKAVAALTALVKAAPTPVVRELSVTALASGRPGSQWLLKAHAAEQLPGDVVATAGRLLRNSAYRDLQNKALVVFPAPGKMSLKKLPAVAVLATRRGEASKGKRLFEQSAKGNLQCLKCHMVRGNGGQIGPDLSMIGKKVSRENLLESILLPSKAVADQFLTRIVQTDKGLVLQGLVVEETADSLVVRDAEGRDTRIAKKEIETSTRGPKSLMPEDLVVQLSEEELIDLVEYLLTLRTAALTVDQWQIVGPFDNGSGMEGLDRVFGPEKGYDPKGSYAGKHGKVSWRSVRIGAGGYVDLKAFHGEEAAESVSYLTREIESPADQEATLLLGSDDGAKVWLNGELVHTSRQTRAAAPEQDTVKVRLRKGANRLLLKINNGDGPHGLYCTLLSEQELKPVGSR